MGYLCANFSLPRPLCCRLRPGVRDRQTSDAHYRLMRPTLGAGHSSNGNEAFECCAVPCHRDLHIPTCELDFAGAREWFWPDALAAATSESYVRKCD